MRGARIVVVAALVSACNAGLSAPTTSPEASTVASTAPTTTLPPVVDCPGVGEFVEGGGVAGIDGEGSDSTALGRVSWTTSDQCESFDFEFVTSEGAPATTVPNIEIEYLSSLQVIRVDMGVGSAALVDQLVETQFVERLYVVRSLGNGLFVDLHLAAPAAARARVTSEPARLTLDLRPGFVEFTGRSSVEESLVLVAPIDGSETPPEVFVDGYTRATDSGVRIVFSQGGSVIEETVSDSEPGAPGWSQFAHQAVLPPGETDLFVGHASADDAQPGLTVSLTVR